MSLTRICPADWEEADGNLAFRVVLAAAAVVDSARKAFVMEVDAFSVQRRMHSFGRLVEYLHRVHERHGQAVRVLRRTAFTPAAMVACLRAILSRAADGKWAGGEEPGEGWCLLAWA